MTRVWQSQANPARPTRRASKRATSRLACSTLDRVSRLPWGRLVTDLRRSRSPPTDDSLTSWSSLLRRRPARARCVSRVPAPRRRSRKSNGPVAGPSPVSESAVDRFCTPWRAREALRIVDLPETSTAEKSDVPDRDPAGEPDLLPFGHRVVRDPELAERNDVTVHGGAVTDRRNPRVPR